MINKKLSIIILSYNTIDLLKQTIKSIPHHDDWEIIIVDNASTDGSIDMIQKDFPQLHLIQNPKNLGFAAANNLGISASTGEYIMLLNSDTQIIDDAIEKLINYLDENEKVGAITPKVILPDGAIDLACHRGMPTPWRALTYFSKLEQLFPNSKTFAGYHQTYQDFQTTHQIEATAATAMMVRREVIDQVGLLDERFFLYAEDLDWCKRITEAGWPIIYYPEVKVLHHKSQSGKQKPSDNQVESHQFKTESIHHFYDTMKQFYDKHYTHQYPKPIQKLIHWSIDLKKKWATRK